MAQVIISTPTPLEVRRGVNPNVEATIDLVNIISGSDTQATIDAELAAISPPLGAAGNISGTVRLSDDDTTLFLIAVSDASDGSEVVQQLIDFLSLQTPPLTAEQIQNAQGTVLA